MLLERLTPNSREDLDKLDYLAVWDLADAIMAASIAPRLSWRTSRDLQSEYYDERIVGLQAVWRLENRLDTQATKDQAEINRQRELRGRPRRRKGKKPGSPGHRRNQ